MQTTAETGGGHFFAIIVYICYIIHKMRQRRDEMRKVKKNICLLMSFMMNLEIIGIE